jgi:HEPN domain-containing protein
MNNVDFQNLSDLRIAEAKTLLDAGRHCGAYYLAGYAVECAIKACLAKRIAAGEWPEKRTAEKWNKHDLEELLDAAGLKSVIDDAKAKSLPLARNWSVVKDWKETRRYEFPTELEAKGLYDACSHPVEGVLPWLRTHW